MMTFIRRTRPGSAVSVSARYRGGSGTARGAWAAADGGRVERSVFSFGHLAGETGDGTLPFRVSAVDVAAVKRSLTTTAVRLTNAADINGDGRVNALDVAAVKRSLTRTLATPVTTVAAPAPGESEDASGRAGVGRRGTWGFRVRVRI